MLYSGQNGPSLVSEAFNQMCVDQRVEATVQAFPNPGQSRAMRIITFRNFNDCTIEIIQSNKTTFIPAKGTGLVMLKPDEPLPTIERMKEDAI
jgi:hypothetical protein